MAKGWDKDAAFGSDILGTGACQGDIGGKVKTAQIGFIRRPKNVRGKVRVSNKGRSQTKPSPRKQKERG